MRFLPWLALVFVLMATSSENALSQTVKGALTDEVTRRPIANAQVLILNYQGAKQNTTRTDSTGSFSFQVIPGAYWIRVQPDGYEIVESRPFIVERPDTLTLALTTRAQVTTLGGVTVRGVYSQNRNYAGFLDRERWALGRFIGPDEVRRERIGRTSDLLSNAVPGIDVDPTRGGVVAFRNRGRVCFPIILLDGVRTPPDFEPDRDVLGADIRAVEIYPQSEFAPPQLTMAPFNQCGVIAIWTGFGLGID